MANFYKIDYTGVVIPVKEVNGTFIEEGDIISEEVEAERVCKEIENFFDNMGDPIF